MKKSPRIISKTIESRIFLIRKQKVMIDLHLAEVYGIPTFRLNEAVKRNRKRFPEDFMFRLNLQEYRTLISQIAMSKKGRGGRRTRPYAFTEHGAIMVANILNSDHAVKMSVFVVRAFLKMRTFFSEHQNLARELQNLERTLTKRLDCHEAAIVEVLRKVMRLLEPAPELSLPEKPQIGFHR